MIGLAADREFELMIGVIEAKCLGTRISETTRSTLSEEQQRIVEFLVADPGLDPSEIAQRMGMSTQKVQRLRAEIAEKLKPHFPQLGLQY